MSSRTRLLPLLALAAPLGAHGFASPPSARRPIDAFRSHVLQAASHGDDNNGLDNIRTAAGSALLGLTLGLASFAGASAADVPSAFSAAPSLSVARAQKPVDETQLTIKELERETRQVEKEAKADQKKARVEKSREAFFEYEAKTAEQTEARIEAAEQKALAEARKDKEEAEKLMALEKKAEREAATAADKKERAAKQKEAKVSCNSGSVLTSHVLICSC